MRSGECSVRNRYRASDARRWSSARRRSNAAERIAATMSIADSTSLPHGFGSPETCRATNPSRRVPNRRGVSSAERTGNGSSSRFNGSDAGRRERSSAWILPSVRIRSSRRSRAGPGRYASLTSAKRPRLRRPREVFGTLVPGPQKEAAAVGAAQGEDLPAHLVQEFVEGQSQGADPGDPRHGRDRYSPAEGTRRLSGSLRETGSPCPSTPPRETNDGIISRFESGQEREPGGRARTPPAAANDAAPSSGAAGSRMTITGTRESRSRIRPLSSKAERNSPRRSAGRIAGAIPPPRYTPPVARYCRTRFPASAP